jgi:hypothetical protein
MITLRLGNTEYHTFQQLQEMTKQFPAIDTPFAQDLLFEFEEFTLMAWLDKFQETIETIKSDRLEALHFHRLKYNQSEVLQEIYKRINQDESHLLM